MTVTLYNNSSDPRVLRKSISKLGSDLTVQITDNCSVENPVFRLALTDDKINANYLYVAKWKKYYYITSRDILNGKEVILNCHIDVLMSFKDSILNTDVICERSSSSKNPYLADDVCADRGTVQQVFRRSSSTPFSVTTNCYVLHIAGKT